MPFMIRYCLKGPKKAGIRSCGEVLSSSNSIMCCAGPCSFDLDSFTFTKCYRSHVTLNVKEGTYIPYSPEEKKNREEENK